MQKLTDRQRAVLDFIIESIHDKGFPPTLREIGNHLGIRSTNGVNDHLRALERKGYLTREDMKSRTVRPVHMPPPPQRQGTQRNGNGASRNGRGGEVVLEALDGTTTSEMPANLVEIPILGNVAAGQPLEAIEEPIDTVHIDRMLVPTRGEVFGLRIQGDSMIEAGIFDGDYVFVKKQIEASKGAIIVALVGEEATCKYYFPEKSHVRLEPANAEMAPILVPKNDWRESQILGVVVGVYRRL